MWLLANALQELGLVGALKVGVPRGSEGRAKEFEPCALRRLRAPQICTRNRLDNIAIGNALDRIDDLDGRDRTAMLAHSADHGENNDRIDQRASDIVHED